MGKRVIGFIGITLLSFAVVLIAAISIVELYPEIHDRAPVGEWENGSDWMGKLDIPDTTLLSNIAIPGVHDAGANYVQLSLFSKCQDADVYDYLNAGYRYLDMRLGTKYVCGEPVLTIYHGFVKCKDSGSPLSDSLYFDKIIEQCERFLDENPTETVLMVVKKEHGDESISEFQELLVNYTADERWLLTDSIPTLAEARGKIVLFRRYEDEANLGKAAGIPLIWDEQRDNDDTSKNVERYENEGMPVLVQDRFKYDADDKLTAFTATLNNKREKEDEDAAVLNFLSTNGTPKYGHPFKYAKTLNESFKLVEGTYEPQWVIVDFATADMARKIATELVNYDEYNKKEEETMSTQEIKAPTPWKYNVDVSWIDTEKPMVALSFDDGPVSLVGDDTSAMRIQNAISEAGFHATFFYWGNTLNDVTVKELERAYELGFELGNHTKSHPDLSKLTADKIEKEVEYMDKKLQAITGQEKFLVRPPFLAVNELVKETIDVPLISCGIDSKDWAGATAEEMIETIKKAVENDTLDGKIVLMHETYDTTAEAVEYLVPYLKDQGYQVVSISEMYCARGKNIASGHVYTYCNK